MQDVAHFNDFCCIEWLLLYGSCDKWLHLDKFCVAEMPFNWFISASLLISSCFGFGLPSDGATQVQMGSVCDRKRVGSTCTCRAALTTLPKTVAELICGWQMENGKHYYSTFIFYEFNGKSIKTLWTEPPSTRLWATNKQITNFIFKWNELCSQQSRQRKPNWKKPRKLS